MRIVAGTWGGRTIQAPPGRGTRPTTDRVREAWMSIVSPELAGARVLDLFAGSGALGLEALSRGASHCTFVEQDAKALAILKANVKALDAADRTDVFRTDALKFAGALTPGAFDIAFADPPYGQDMATRLAKLWLAKPFARILGVEHRVDEQPPGSDDRRRYGDTAITFYRAADDASDHAILEATDEPDPDR